MDEIKRGGIDIPTVEIPERIYDKLKAFASVVKVVVGEDIVKVEPAYVGMVLELGLERMLLDVIPKEEILQNTMRNMFNQNPEFVSKFVAETLAKGELIRKEEEKKAEESWKKYIG